MKHAITILGVATLLAGAVPAVYAQSTQTQDIQTRADDLFQQGEAKRQSGDFKGAVKIYNQVLQLDATNTSAYVSRGIARFELRDKQGAIDDFTQALQLNGNDAEVYRKRGSVYLTLGNKKAARNDFQQAAKLSGSQSGGQNSQ